MVCVQRLRYLEQIGNYLKDLSGEDEGIRGLTAEGWSFYRKGKSVFYEKRLTYAGGTEFLDLQFSIASQINRIEQIWSTADAKSGEIRMYGPGNTAYTVLDSITADITQSRLLQLGIEYKYIPATILKLYYSATVNADIITVRVQADDL